MNKESIDKTAEIVNGIPVYITFKGQPAYESGIRQGDIITSVNGVETPTVDEYVEAVKLDGDTRTVGVWRKGQELTFEIDLTKKKKASEAEIAEMMKEAQLGDFLLGEKKGIGEA